MDEKNSSSQKGASVPSAKERTEEIFSHDQYLSHSQLEKLENELGIKLWINTQFYIATADLLSDGAIGSADLFKTILAVSKNHPPEPIIDSYVSKIRRKHPNFDPNYFEVKLSAVAKMYSDSFKPDSNLRFTTEAKKALKQAARLAKFLKHENSDTLCPCHLILGLLKHQGGSLKELLSGANLTAKDLILILIDAVGGFSYPRDEMARWYSFSESVTEVPYPRESSGRLHEFSRDGPDNTLTSDTSRYASAIASVFRNGGDRDFSMAIFGPWGRGKTTLVEKISEALSEPSTTEAVYQTITFNAWKYPNRPEVWLHLYEEIKKVATDNSPFKSLRLAVQSKLLADGGLPLLMPSLLLLFASVPKLGLVQWLLPGFAILSGFLLLKYFKAFQQGVLPVLQTYLKLPDHSENLGLQSTVGDQLTRLLKVWAGRLGMKNRFKFFWSFGVSLLLMITSLSILWSHLPAEAFPALRWMPGLAIAGLIIFGLVSLWPVKGPDKAFLVVDDLDRCRPDQMLAVIEAIRVFLDDDEISRRLQVAMLVDKEILSDSICRKYRSILRQGKNSEDNLSSRFTADSIVEEELQKLFVLRFTLPPFGYGELKEAAEKIFGITDEGRASEVEESDILSDSIEGSIGEPILRREKKHDASMSEVSIIVDPGKPDEEKDPEIHDIGKLDQQLTDDEKSALRMLVILGADMTPRKIRSLRLRYLFGRHLMLELHGPSAPLRELREALDPNIDRERQDGEVRQIVEMIG